MTGMSRHGMASLTLAAVLVSAALGCTRCPRPTTPAVAPRKEFSMRLYYMALLRRGPAWTAEETEATRALGEGHMAHIRAMGESGKLLVAGPFEPRPDAPADALAGILLFDVATREEAVALANDDPAVRAGRLTIEVLEWYGPAGLTYDGHEAPPTAAAP